MEHNYTQLAEELRKRMASSIMEVEVEVSESDGEADGIWITNKGDLHSIHRFMEVADFCRYHDLSAYVTNKLIVSEPPYERIPAIRIF